MRLLLLRHGEASLSAETDAQRPLTARGRDDIAASLERYLAWRVRQTPETASESSAAVMLETAALVASPLLRAQETLAIVAEKLLDAVSARVLQAIEVEPDGKSWLLPNTPSQTCLQNLARLEEAGVEELWLIAHNPLLSEVLGLLVDADRYSQPSLTTAELLELDCEPLAMGCATVEYRA